MGPPPEDLPRKEKTMTDAPKYNPTECDELIKEADALALYIAQRGDTLPVIGESLYDQLLSAIKDAKSNPSACHCQSLMKSYANITATTYKERGVNGRTILDTGDQPPRWSRKWLTAPRNRPGVIGVSLFISALILEALARWIGTVSAPKEFYFGEFFYHLTITFTTFLIPVVWGGIGSCVFLMKRLSDKLFHLAYDKARVRGDVTRIILGAMLGLVIVVFFYRDFDDKIREGNIELAYRSAAFVAGLGVKPIYAAFESMTQELAQRFKGKGGTK